MNNIGRLISANEFHDLAEKEIIIDGRNGGLVVGNSHRNGGIQMFNSIGPDNIYHVGEMEGFEFLINEKSFEKYSVDIQNINNQMRILMKRKDILKSFMEHNL